MKKTKVKIKFPRLGTTRDTHKTKSLTPSDQLSLIYWQLMKVYQNSKTDSKKAELDRRWEEYKKRFEVPWGS